jgi:hypothetical protein
MGEHSCRNCSPHQRQTGIRHVASKEPSGKSYSLQSTHVLHQRPFSTTKKGLEKVNLIMKHEPELRSLVEPWSMGAIYETLSAEGTFFKYCRKLKEAVYKDEKDLAPVR